MSGVSKMQGDAIRWAADPTTMPDGWTRIDVPAGAEPWRCLPDDVEERDRLPRLMFEYRESSVMGWGCAAVWIGPSGLE